MRDQAADGGEPVLTRRQVLRIMGLAATGTLLSACAGRSPSPSAPTGDFSARFAGFAPAEEPNVTDLSRVVWPDFVTQAGPEVRRLYEFQLQNGQLMRYMPCFCGCGDRHRSNRDCYVERIDPDGTVVFDSMAPT